MTNFPKITDECYNKAVIQFFKNVQRIGSSFLSLKEYHDLFQAKFFGKWASLVDQTNNNPIVAEALAQADNEQAN